jgi:hypothetical protein
VRKLISTAAFGEGDKYCRYLPSFVLAHLNLFPIDEDWQLRVHIDPIVAASKWGAFLFHLSSRGLVQVDVRKSDPLTKAMLWRLAPIFDNTTDYVFSRDLDAAPLPRDRRCCEQFIVSGLNVHTILDHLQHAGIMGGLCGFKAIDFMQATRLHSLDALYAEAAESNEAWAKHGTDQNVLNRLIANRIDVKLLEHRFAGWTDGKPGTEARPSGMYSCQSWSTMIPDVGLSRLSEELTEKADALAGHMGAAGYDHAAARKFWMEHGDASVNAAVIECEKFAGLS